MKKLEGNGMWESSRMMRFEHRDTLIGRKEEKERRTRPLLDEQQLEELSGKLAAAYAARTAVIVRVFGEFGERILTGVIAEIDPQGRRLRINRAWIPLADILEITDE